MCGLIIFFGSGGKGDRVLSVECCVVDDDNDDDDNARGVHPKAIAAPLFLLFLLLQSLLTCCACRTLGPVYVRGSGGGNEAALGRKKGGVRGNDF